MLGTERMMQYIDWVLSPNNNDVGKYVKLQAKRHLDDLEKSKDDSYPYCFDEDKANRIVKFIESMKLSESDFHGKNLLMEPWQCFAMCLTYGWVRKDNHEIRRFTKINLLVGRKNGKGLELTTPIHTPSGDKLFGDIHEGDIVYGDDGKPVKVLWESEVRNDIPCYEMTFSNGDKFKVWEDHLWNVTCNKYGWEYQTRDTKSLYDEFTRLKGRRYDHKFVVPTALPMDKPKADLPIDPYVLGLWLGDGNKDSGTLHLNGDDIEEILDSIHEVGYETSEPKQEHVNDTPRNCYRVRIYGMASKLRQIGLINNKHIPKEYLESSIEQRLSLIQGLMDTDGDVSKKGYCAFSQKRKPIVDMFCALLNSLQIQFTCAHRWNRCQTGVFDIYKVYFYMDKTMSCFRLKRKYDRLKDKLAKSNRVYIDNIIPCDPVPCKCIAVDNDSHLFCVGEHNTVTHNSTLISSVCLFDVLSAYSSEAYTVANKLDQARRIWQSCANMIGQNASLSKRLKIVDSTSRIYCSHTGSYIKALASDSKKLDGLNPSVVCIDEVACMRDASIVKVMQSGQGSRPSPLLFMLSSASEDVFSLGSMEFEHSRKILEGAVDEPNYLPLLWCIDEEDDPFDEKVWKKANPNLGVSVKPEFLQMMARESKNNPIMKQEFICKCMARFEKETLTSFVDSVKWRNLVYENPHKLDLSKPFYSVCGCDFSKSIDLTSYSIDAYQDGHHHLITRSFFPEGQWIAKLNNENILFGTWVEQGWLTKTSGDVINYQEIMEQFLKDMETYKVREFLFDPWGASKFTIDLDNDGRVDLVEIPQNYKSFSPMLKAFQSEILEAKVQSDNPVLMWANSNSMVKPDNNNNILLVKLDNNRNKNGVRVDPMVASAMAVGRMEQLVANGEVDLRSPEEIEQDMKALFSSLKW